MPGSRPLEARAAPSFNAGPAMAVPDTRRSTAGMAKRRASAVKVTCDECYFRQNLLCALATQEPCPTFRPAGPQLAPPRQLHFAFRHDRRTRTAWAFPSAQEQAALRA
jgi:hypothetical protein